MGGLYPRLPRDTDPTPLKPIRPPGVESGLMSQLGPFLLQERLADGGMSQLWRAQTPQDKIPVAIKVLTAQTGERERRALSREVRAVAGLDHPNIVKVLDAGRVPAHHPILPAGAPYLAMALAKGGSLAQRLGQIPWQRMQGMLADILRGLAHAHARGVVHLDIKPGNILLSDRAQAILADFGLAHALGSAQGRPVIEGTPAYMAPEQLMGNWRAYGPWTDLYAVGALTWELCSSKPPFVASDPHSLRQAHLNQDPPNFRAILDVPRALEPWLRRLLIKSPAERYRCAADALDALLRLGPPRQPQVWAAAKETWAPGMPALSHVPPAPRKPAPFPDAPVASHGRTVLQGLGLGLFAQRRVPMVGREAQQRLLWDGLRRVHLHRKIHGVLLEGPAGVGKSHLARWIAEQAAATGTAVVLRASHSPIGAQGEGIPGALARHFSVVGLEEPEHHIAQSLAALGTNPYESKALAQWILPEQARDLSLKVRVGILARLLATQDRPVVLILDDVQWSEEALPIALGLMERIEALPVFLVMTLRQDGLSPLKQGLLDRLLDSSRFRAQHLRPLDNGEVTQLIDAMLHLEPGLKTQLLQRCAGNPLMAVQAMGSLVEQGALRPDPAGFTLQDPQASVPRDLRTLWDRRLPQLNAAERQALELAATLGHQLSEEEWAGVCPPGTDLAGLKHALMERELARPWPGGWAFVHSLLPETLLQDAAREGRAPEHHRRCAAYLGAQGEDLRRAKHLLAAGDLDLAAQALALAGAQARFGTDPSRSLAILTLLEETLAQLPGHTLASERIQGALYRASYTRHLGQFEEAHRLLNQALTQARDLGDHWLTANTLTRKGEVYRQQGQLKMARRVFEQGRSICQKQGLIDLEMECMFGLSDVARQQRAWDEAISLLEAAASTWVELEPNERGGRSTRDRASILRSLAAVYRAQGDLDKAQQVLAEGLNAARVQGLGISLANILNDMGEQARLSGRLGDAKTLYQEAAEMTDAVGSYGGVYPRLNLGLLGIQLGDLDLATQACAAALTDCERYALPQLVPGIQVCLAWCAAAMRDWLMVEERLSLAEIGFAQHADLDPDNAWPALLTARLCLQGERPRLARMALEVARSQYQGLDDAQGLAKVDALAAQL